MRRVDKGNHPCQGDGCEDVFLHYKDAAEHLFSRLGCYCSFCERKIAAGLAVEHKSPKSKYPELVCSWTNLLLACVNCNSVKRDRMAKSAMWPDEHDTFLAFVYERSGKIRVSSSLSEAIRNDAQDLLQLVGLDRVPNQSRNDHRWFDRLEIWRIAEQSREDLQQNNSPGMRRSIINTAICNGHFSIWMKVFHEDAVMLSALIQAFPGTVDHRVELDTSPVHE